MPPDSERAAQQGGHVQASNRLMPNSGATLPRTQTHSVLRETPLAIWVRKSRRQVTSAEGEGKTNDD